MVMFNLNWKVLSSKINSKWTYHKRISQGRPTSVPSSSTPLFVSQLKSFSTKTITPQIQKKTNGEIKLPRRLEKRPDTLLSTLSQTVRNSITRLSESGHEQMVTRSIYPWCPNLIHCMIQGSQNGIWKVTPFPMKSKLIDHIPPITNPSRKSNFLDN